MNYEEVSIIRKLPLKLRRNSFDYNQVLRGQRTCIYAQKVPKNVKYQKVKEYIVYFEVFLIKVIPYRTIIINGEVVREVPAHEKYPHNEAFGYWAWSFESYERALKKYNELEQEGGDHV